jgi:hypothetical protein
MIKVWDPLRYCEQHLASLKASVLVPAIFETEIVCLTTEMIVPSPALSCSHYES